MSSEVSYSDYYPVFKDINELNSVELNLIYVDFIVAKKEEITLLELPIFDQTAMMLLIHAILEHIRKDRRRMVLSKWYDEIIKFLECKEIVYQLLDVAITQGTIIDYKR